MPTIVVYITCKNDAEARNISTALLKARLVACTNRFPVSSQYRWKGKLVNDREVLLIAKTQAKHYVKIVKLVTKLHSYDVPCIGKFKIAYNKPYAKWLMEETRQ